MRCWNLSYDISIEAEKGTYTEEKLQMNPNEDKDIKSESRYYSIECNSRARDSCDRIERPGRTREMGGADQ